jgi:hypothetical protein
MMSAKKVAFGTQPPQKPVVTPESWVEGNTAGEGTKRLTIDLPESLHRRVKIGCAQRGEKMADVIRALLEKEFSQ